MYTLLLDSSNTSLTVGLAKDDVLLESVSYESWQQQSELMVPEINSLLEKYSVSKNDISNLMVACGPGSYTGVRIALTIAKTIATALNIDVYLVSSLAVLKKENFASICLINARSNRSYIGIYKNAEVILEDQIMTNEEVKQFIIEHPEYIVCGDTKYLGIEGHTSNVAKEMLAMKPFLKKSSNPLGIKPVYLKD